MTYDHVQFFEANAFYVLSVYFLTGGIFFYCFYKQLAFSPRDSLLLSGVLAIALFMGEVREEVAAVRQLA